MHNDLVRVGKGKKLRGFEVHCQPLIFCYHIIHTKDPIFHIAGFRTIYSRQWLSHLFTEVCALHTYYMICIQVCVFRIARMMLQKKYQERVNQCVSKLTQHKEPCLPDTDVYSLIAETLGLETDATSKLSSLCNWYK